MGARPCRSLVKLCLDEHYSAQIAERLRDAGHDVISVKERPDLVSLPDGALLAVMAAEQRAFLTENVGDFSPLIAAAASRGESHFGFIFSSSHSMSRSRNTIGLFVERLDKILREHPGDSDLTDRVEWLSPV